MGLESLFSIEKDFNLLRSCVDGLEALEAVSTFKPDILLLDMQLPKLDGLGVLRELASTDTRVRTIVLSATLEAAEMRTALRLGARGLLLKAQAPQQLVKCVRTVHMGGWWLEQSGVYGASYLDDVQGSESNGSSLTEREQEIARLVAEGRRNKEIAQALAITEGTVKVHLGNIYRKLDVTSRVGLVLHSKSSGLKH
jgi:DNA-binding NarL/FixJ family response regulator